MPDTVNIHPPHDFGAPFHPSEMRIKLMQLGRDLAIAVHISMWVGPHQSTEVILYSDDTLENLLKVFPTATVDSIGGTLGTK